MPPLPVIEHLDVFEAGTPFSRCPHEEIVEVVPSAVFPKVIDVREDDLCNDSMRARKTVDA
jgi:hypothetical protein